MTKFYATLVCLALIGGTALFVPRTANTKVLTPPAGKTGAPGEQTCATTGCHTNSSGGSGNVALSFSGGATYMPGSTYTLGIVVNEPSPSGTPKYGFELTAVDVNDDKAGTLSIVDPNNTSMPTGAGSVGNREYIGHKSANANNTWQVQWTAPATSVGDVTFYYAGNAGNGTNTAAGDKVYLGNTTISVNTAVAITGSANSSFHVQNPAIGKIDLVYTVNETSFVTADLFDATGKNVMQLERTHAAGGNHAVTKALNVTPGLYFVRMNINGNTQTRKVIVL